MASTADELITSKSEALLYLSGLGAFVIGFALTLVGSVWAAPLNAVGVILAMAGVLLLILL